MKRRELENMTQAVEDPWVFVISFFSTPNQSHAKNTKITIKGHSLHLWMGTEKSLDLSSSP